MVKSILLILVVFFTVLGICEIINFIKLLFYYPGIKTKKYTIAILHNNYAIKELMLYWQTLKWYGEIYSNTISAIVDDLDNNEILDCYEFVKGKNIELRTIDSLSEYRFTQGDM